MQTVLSIAKQAGDSRPIDACAECDAKNQFLLLQTDYRSTSAAATASNCSWVAAARAGDTFSVLFWRGASALCSSTSDPAVCEKTAAASQQTLSPTKLAFSTSVVDAIKCLGGGARFLSAHPSPRPAPPPPPLPREITSSVSTVLASAN